MRVRLANAPQPVEDSLVVETLQDCLLCLTLDMRHRIASCAVTVECFVETFREARSKVQEATPQSHI